MINKDDLKEFTKITGFDLTSYFEKSLSFLAIDFGAITNYYKGLTESINSSAFTSFDEINKLTKECLQQFYINRDRFEHYKWWDILEQVEELDSRFETLKNMNRWARSSAKNFGFDANPRFDYVLSQKQTLERISRDFLKSNNPQDDWFDIAKDNDLIEEDYTSEGGSNIKLTLSKQLINFDISSVVDSINEKSVYGKDINKYITFIEDDLEVLSYEDTILQAADILVSLKKGDNPDRPDLGIQKSVVLGVSKANFNIPILSRQLQACFASDDSLKNFNIKNVKFESDIATIDYSVQTRLGEVIEQSIVLQ